MKWLLGGLIGCGVIALVAAGVAGYFAYQAVTKLAGSVTGVQQPAPATAAAQASFVESVHFAAPNDVAALASGDMTQSGVADIVALAGPDVVVVDQAGKRIGAFATGLPPSPSMGRMPGFATAAYAPRLRTGTLHKQPALVVASTLGDAVVGYARDGRELLRNAVSGTRVTGLEVADVNGDGKSEILVGRDSQLGLTCLNGAGATEWQFGVTTQPSIVVVADGTGDGKPEVYVGESMTGATPITVLDNHGKQIGRWPGGLGELALAAADLDNDQKAEFLAIALDLRPQAGRSPARSLGSAFNVSLVGLSSAGKEGWRTSLGGGMASMFGVALGAGDFDGDGKGEWIVNGPDGTLRVYNRDGVELCRQAMGQYIAALTVTPPGKKGGRARAWVAMGRRIVGLDWQKWMTGPAPSPGARKAKSSGG
jgi:hypothetical protein